ncbi:hypothetical protein MsedC_1701 [Metallosphaera sedula]|uniref:Glycosyltransferase RgtA/B/C/D-like domain-containing protein n=2 Tax=Metallosphaera TaxID=41980 RepID=A0A0K1SJ58_9CREN|nr:hypothetical protein MsedA_1701 [Metallosphaera sedula]QCO30760.1 hypothetical protein DFR88_09910 [Metallosphaera prunae]AKV76893.1 hypothetical protein MsedB_1703 [Metallosphaera sedula]AKV79144.1 hypothetical protein MsedC_1701 [Metallosphaera sedula]AKV81389.1 hypothetical protein MsedD_1702 [Metallosphaera sedula]
MLMVPIALFLFYGIMSPIYYHLLKDKMSNQTAFAVTWVTAPFLASYPYLSSYLYILPIILALNIIGYILIIKKSYKYIYNGLLFLTASVITILFFKLLPYI